mmetsp:Transcript_727/g.896  ORF Transcript_727/g.896 Transcript_727/m.896 type:complete len:492 (+) Transcript_727:325-1800(+)
MTDPFSSNGLGTPFATANVANPNPNGRQSVQGAFLQPNANAYTYHTSGTTAAPPIHPAGQYFHAQTPNPFVMKETPPQSSEFPPGFQGQSNPNPFGTYGDNQGNRNHQIYSAQINPFETQTVNAQTQNSMMQTQAVVDPYGNQITHSTQLVDHRGAVPLNGQLQAVTHSSNAITLDDLAPSTSLHPPATQTGNLLEFDPFAKKPLSPKSIQQQSMKNAAELNRRGIIDNSDRVLVKDLILKSDLDMQSALAAAIQGDMSLYDQVLAREKGKASEMHKNDGNDSDSDSNTTLTDGEAENEGLDGKGAKSSLYKEMVEAQRFAAPHPRAGGFKKELPSQLYMIDGKFMGHIMVRVSSKKVFRKWKIMFFVLDTSNICFYESSRQWEASAPPRLQFGMHSLMFICKPTLKNTYSVMDNGKRVYYSVFRENVVGPGSRRSFQMQQAIATASKFSPALESRRICKFGAHRNEVITAFAYAIHGVIASKVREKASEQ